MFDQATRPGIFHSRACRRAGLTTTDRYTVKNKTFHTKEKEEMKNSIKPIPDGYHTLTPHLAVKDASNAIEFYKKAFGAKEIRRVPGPDGKSLIHAELPVGDSRLLAVHDLPESHCRRP